jgi:hypothetical protein
MKQELLDPRLARALWRYEVISAFIADNPPRGRRGALLRQLANKTWPDEQGRVICWWAPAKGRSRNPAGLDSAISPKWTARTV